MSILELIKDFGPIVLTFFAGLVGVRVGIRQIRVEKYLSMTEQQLNCLYSPLLGLRYSIKAKSDLRVEISTAAEEAWQVICGKHKGDTGWNSNGEYEPFGKIIDYENQQLTAELLPNYREMLKVFTENLWLAEPETRQFYPELSRFVDIWDRWLAKSIPADVLRLIDHKEARLYNFYAHLEKIVDFLKGKLHAE
jgi:hypothetical protein